MALRTGNELWDEKPENQRAIPSFDVSGGNTDMVLGILAGAETLGACIFLSSTPSSVLSYLGFERFVGTIRELARSFDVDYALHLDHSESVEHVATALDAGFSSVMYDGSQHAFDENVANTRTVISLARTKGVSVEAELGVIGGKEDDLEQERSLLPTFEQCQRFVTETGSDWFAPAVGTVHGEYRSEPQIDWELVEQLAGLSGAHLVLHGGSGLGEVHLKRFINYGFRKANFATGVRQAYRQGLRGSLDTHPKALKPQRHLVAARQAVEEFVVTTLRIFCA